jgi:hypothetical protein
MDNLKENRTFDHFPPERKCPICGDSEDGECVLVGIQGTQADGNIEAVPVHLSCLSNPKRYLYNRDANVIYVVCREVKHGD